MKFYDFPKKNKKYISNLIKYIKIINSSGLYISDKFTKTFERNFSKFNNTKYSVGVGNGFDAIFLSLQALKILNFCKDGDEVIVPANSYIATMLPVNASNLKPVFVEPETDGFNIDPNKIKSKITSKTKAIIVTHLYGHVAEMKQICDIVKKYKLKLIEDCSQAHGAYYKNKNVGNFGISGAFSLFPGKNLGAFSDAGIITTNSLKFRNILLSIRNYGEEHYYNLAERKYKNIYKGFNSRMSELNAVFLNDKLKDLKKENQKRSKFAEIYLKNIKNKKIILPEVKYNTKPVWHQFIILCKNRNKLKKYLLDNDVPTKILYPIDPSNQTAYNEFKKYKFPRSEFIHRNNLALPIETHLSKKEILKICEIVNSYKL